MIEHPRVKFGFYSSIILKNIKVITKFMFDKNLPFLIDKFLIFDQRYNTSAPEITGKPYG